MPPILKTAMMIERRPTDRFPEMLTRKANRMTPTANIGTSGPPAMSNGRKTYVANVRATRLSEITIDNAINSAAAAAIAPGP